MSRKIRGFQLQGSNAAIGAGATADLLAGLDVNVPSNQFLIITGIATYTGSDVAAWGKVVWNFFDNGQPMDRNYFNQSDQMGQQSQPLILAVPVRVEPGHTISVPVKNNDAVAHGAGVLLVGYYGID